MPLFEFEAGRLVPAQLGYPVDEPLEPEVLDAVRDQVLEAIQRPLFAVSWTENEGDSRRLIAMDATGKAVTVEVVERLDAATLVGALSRAGRTSDLGWLQVAELYPRGVAAFRRDWNAFRESIPASIPQAPRLVVVASGVEDEVRPALEVLGESGVAVHEVSVRRMSSGRVFLSVDELRPQAITAADRVLSGRAASRRALPHVLTEAVPEIGLPPQVPPLWDVPDDDAAESPETAAESPEAAAETPDEAYDVAEPASTDPAGADAAPAAEGAPDADAERAESPEPAADAEPAPVAPRPDPERPLGTLPAPGGAHTGSEPAAPADGERNLAVIAQWLGEDTALAWIQHRRGIAHDAVLTAGGTVRLPGGAEHSDPTVAARAVSGRDVDGWRVWRFGDGGPSLADAWDEIRAAGDRGPTSHGRRRR